MPPRKKSNSMRFRLFRMFFPLLASGPFSAFSQKNCPFPLKWVTLLCHVKFYKDPHLCWCAQRCFRQNDNLLFFTRSDGFSPRFCWDTRGGKLLPFQWPFVALPVMCDPVLFDFICSLSSPLFTLISWNCRAETLDVHGRQPLTNPRPSFPRAPMVSPRDSAPE